jgi:hypothetical protein
LVRGLEKNLYNFQCVVWKINFHRVENVSQGNGIIIDITFPVYGLENKFQCPGIDIFMPETDKFRPSPRFEVVFFAVYDFLGALHTAL